MLKITIEGPQGSGKTTVARIVFLALSRIGGRSVHYRDLEEIIDSSIEPATVVIETKQTQ